MKKVLIIEKNIHYLSGVKNALHDVTTVDFYYTNKEREILNYIKNINFDLVVIDFDLLHINGISILNLIKSKKDSSNTKIIFTSWEMTSDVFTTVQKNKSSYLLKPFFPEVLYKNINFLLEDNVLKNSTEIESFIEETLSNIGLKSKLLGYTYTKKAIQYCYTKSNLDNISITKDLYSFIEKETGTSVANIERNIRNAIHSAINENLDNYIEILGIPNVEKTPTNKQFILELTYYIKRVSEENVA